MTDKEKIERLAKYFPIVRELKDERKAAMAAEVWFAALKDSPWDDLEQARFKSGYQNVTLVSHVNSAIEMALAVAKISTKYHGIVYDEQKIILFGLLHDVDKTLEYVLDKDGRVVDSELGKKITHGVLTAMYARDAGFDMEMVHLILTHTSDCPIRTEDKEAVLFGHADIADWDLTCKYVER